MMTSCCPWSELEPLQVYSPTPSYDWQTPKSYLDTNWQTQSPMLDSDNDSFVVGSSFCRYQTTSVTSTRPHSFYENFCA